MSARCGQSAPVAAAEVNDDWVPGPFSAESLRGTLGGGGLVGVFAALVARSIGFGDENLVFWIVAGLAATAILAIKIRSARRRDRLRTEAATDPNFGAVDW